MSVLDNGSNTFLNQINGINPDGDTRIPYTFEGTVMDINDPENRFRAKIRVPILSGMESTIGWAEPEGMGAESIGINMYPPYVGQRVFVYFLEGDPRRPIYKLASLKQNERSTPNGVRYIMSQYFMMQFDDENQVMSIGDKAGRVKIVLDSKQGTVTIGGINIQLFSSVASIIKGVKAVILGRNVKQTKKDI